jgi:hypothetical protein
MMMATTAMSPARVLATKPTAPEASVIRIQVEVGPVK